MADLLGADPRGIVFGLSMTQLTFDLARSLAAGWRPGDEIVVSGLDQDANIRPWAFAAESAGATVRWAEFDPDTGELGVADVAAVISPRTRLVAVTAASNLIGTRPAVAEIAALANEVGALCFVDGVHFTVHASVDVAAMGADFYACSPYEFLGPHCGVLSARPGLLDTLRPEKVYAPGALEASRHLGVGDRGALRIGLAPYTDTSDVERSLDGLHEFLVDGFPA